MDSTLLIELVNAQLHAVARLLAVAGQRAGQVLDRANHDFVFAHALLISGQSGAAHGPSSQHEGCGG